MSPRNFGRMCFTSSRHRHGWTGRIWLRIRAERFENGFTDTANYVYADQNVGPFNDAFRRIVVSKTTYLRNARPSS